MIRRVDPRVSEACLKLIGAEIKAFEVDSGILERVKGSFDRTKFMKVLEVNFEVIYPGHTELFMKFNPDNTQQNGFVHAGVTCTLLDSVGGWCALSMAPEGADVLSASFSIDLLRPGKIDTEDGGVLAIARVLKAGRTLTTTRADAFAIQDPKDPSTIKHIAAMQQSIAIIHPR